MGEVWERLREVASELEPQRIYASAKAVAHPACAYGAFAGGGAADGVAATGVGRGGLAGRETEDDFRDFGDVVGLGAEVDDAGAEGEFAVDDGVR